jgi:hypothetical protein
MSDATAFTKSDSVDVDPKQALEQLVGEGKKYATVEEAAKGLWHAQKHIAGLESNYAELQKELNKRLTAEELLKKVIDHKDTTPAQTSAKGEPQSLDIEALLKKAEESAVAAVQKRELETSASKNEERITEALVKKYGTMEKAAEAARQAAQTYGVSIDEFQQMARTKPRVVEGLLGLNDSKQRQSTPSPLSGSLNTAGVRQNNDATDGSPEYWEKMRQADPKKYYSRDMSRKRIQDSIKHRMA